MRRLTILSIFAAAVMTASCTSFLERTSQNLIVPTSVQHYKEMLQGPNGYFRQAASSSMFATLMTDDILFTDVSREAGVSKPAESSSLSRYRLAYQWADEIENDEFTDGAFNYFYSQVLIANTVLDKIEKLDDPDGQRDLLHGQALFHRALAYFYLANLYGPAYNEASPEAPCVPLKLDPTPSTDTFARSSVAEVWGSIREDLDAAIALLEKFDVKNVHEINVNAALALACRVALFMEDFDAAVEYGERVLKNNSALYDITSKKYAADPEGGSPLSSTVINFISYANPEILWIFSQKASNYQGGLGVEQTLFYAPSKDLISTYSLDLAEGERDHRLDYFFIPPGWSSLMLISSYYYCYSLLKYDSNDMQYSRCTAFRTGEVYLNMAEAYARSGHQKEAVDLLNRLRAKRVSDYTPLETVPDLLTFIYRERRRELVGEDLHRWWDVRRTGQKEIVHPWKDGTRYVLKDHDKAFVLDYPLAERAVCPDNYNERPHRQAE